MKHFTILFLFSLSISAFAQDAREKDENKEQGQTQKSVEELQPVEKEEGTENIPKYDDATKEKAEQRDVPPVEEKPQAVFPEEELLKQIDQETMEEIDKELDQAVQQKLDEDFPESLPEKSITEDFPAENKNVEPQVEKIKEYHHYYNDYHERNKIHTLSNGHGGSGGYGALIFKATDFDETSLLLAGFRGMWVINRSFGIGVEANGIIPVSKFDNIDPEGFNRAILVGGYGGLALEPIFWSNSVIHFTFPVSFGGGWLGYMEDWQDQYYYYNPELYDQDVFWYVEPGANLEFNIARFFRIDLGVTKRFTYDLNLIQTGQEAFDNWNYTFTMKFGGF